MKKTKSKYRKKQINLDTIQLNAKRFVLGPLWRKDEKKQRLFRPYYISR